MDTNEINVNEQVPAEQQPENPQNDMKDDSCILHISNFEGPLDLLWNLIKKAKIDIMEVSISQITEQYVSYLKMMESMNVSVATDFIIMASELLYYKSKSLLPTGEIDDEFFIPPLPPELVQKLLEYKKYQKASQNLKGRYDLNQDSYTRKSDISDLLDSGEWQTMSLYDLLNAFSGVLVRTEKVEEKTIKFDEVLVSDKLRMIIERLQKKDRIDFFALFSIESTRGEIIATFLAILELTKIQKIRILQSVIYDDIAIFRLFEPGTYMPDDSIVTSVNI